MLRRLFVLPLLLALAGCDEPGNNTCFSTANLDIEQTAWFIEAADDWNIFETLAQAKREGVDPPDEPIEYITVNDSCAKVGFGGTVFPQDEIAHYDGHTIMYVDDLWTRCAFWIGWDFGTVSRHEMGHALGYSHSKDSDSIMHRSAWLPCATLATNPP